MKNRSSSSAALVNPLAGSPRPGAWLLALGLCAAALVPVQGARAAGVIVDIGTPSVVANGCTTALVYAPFAGDTNANSSSTFEQSSTSTGPWTRVCTATTGGSPRTCLASGLSNASPYYFRVLVTDPDGVTGTSTQVIGPVATLDCRTWTAPPTARADSCHQVSVSSSFQYDADQDSTVTFSRATTTPVTFADLPACTAGYGSSPRVCVDSTVTPGTTYYYRATFVDTDGIVNANPQTSTAISVPSCPVLTMATGTMPVAANMAVNGTSVQVGQFTLTATGATVTLTAFGVRNVSATNPATPGTDVASLTFLDVTGGVTSTIGVATYDGTMYSVPGNLFDVPVGVPHTINVYANLAPGATAGKTFQARFATSDLTISSATAFASAAGGPVQGNVFTIVGPSQPDGSRLTTDVPMVLIVNPSSGNVVSGPFRLQVHVYDPSAAGVTAVNYSTDGGITWSADIKASVKANFNVGTNAAIYETTLSLVEGAYTLRARASNAIASNVNSAAVPVKVVAALRGDGNLLGRDNSAQLCTDCHNLTTHSSQNTSNKYGSWAIDCRGCHTPHRTTNIYLIKTSITPPTLSTSSYQGAKTVSFLNTTGDALNSFVNSSSTGGQGPCQVCHTQTSGAGAIARWRNTGNADSHYNATSTGGTKSCLNCHDHQAGFAGAGEPASPGTSCGTCHSTLFAAMKNRITSASSSAHFIALDSPTDSGISWANPLSTNASSSRSCVNMCHGDHPHGLTSPATTHEYNAYLNPSTSATRQNTTSTAATRTRIDQATSTATGMCISCHQNPIDSTHPAINAAVYTSSTTAHNFVANTVTSTYTWGYTLHDGGQFQRNCTKCHASYLEGVTPTITTAGSSNSSVHYSTSTPALLAGNLNPKGSATGFVCFNCHGAAPSPADGAQGDRSRKNIQAELIKTYRHPIVSSVTHDAGKEQNATWSDGTFELTGRHAHCGDCHDPHSAGTLSVPRSTNATIDANRNKQSVQPGYALYGADGIQFKTYPTLPAAACGAGIDVENACVNQTTNVNFSTTTTQATFEYEVCFKCHTSFAWGTLATNPNATSTGASGLKLTDVAAEFSPTNKSYHPVVTGTAVGSSALTAAQLTAPWNVAANLGKQTMLCSDCHSSDASVTSTAAVQGPHGSAVKFFLAGQYKNWPYTTTSSATLLAMNSVATNKVFCMNCHPVPTGSNTFHTIVNGAGGQHSGNYTACVGCHIRVPHGGKVSRLIVTANAPARYKAVATPTFAHFTKSATYTWAVVDPNCGNHGGVTTGEAW